MARGGRTVPPASAGRARPRVRPLLAARRREQDRLIDAAIAALADRAAALATIDAARASLDDAMAALAAVGIGTDEVVAILGVPAHTLGGDVRRPGRGGAATRGAPTTAAAVEASVAYADGGEGNPVRVWLAMIEKGASPKTHGLDQDGWLLCRGTGDPEHLATWVGYAFDVDCQRCIKLLAQELSEDEFG
jgi:hypothetical protein